MHRLTEESNGRQLWNNGNRENSYNLWRVASAAYDGATNFNNGWTAWAACMVDYKSGDWNMGQARAQFFYKVRMGEKVNQRSEIASVYVASFLNE